MLKKTTIETLFARESRWFAAILRAIDLRDRRRLARAQHHHKLCIDAIRKHREFHPYVLTVEL